MASAGGGKAQHLFPGRQRAVQATTPERGHFRMDFSLASGPSPWRSTVEIGVVSGLLRGALADS
eukprot:6257715-Pyramimonas_sp.AAC.1